MSTIDVGVLEAMVGQESGPGDWVAIPQTMIDGFAAMTGDRQWIHVDVERATRESPFGGTVAHGLLVLSLVPGLIQGRAPWLEGRLGLNAGADRLRFISPVRAGSRVRARQQLVSVEPHGAGGAKVVTRVTVELEGQAKPACVVDMIGVLVG
jgi:acyl dehydratase